MEALGARGLTDGMLPLVRRLSEFRPDILHTHNPGSHRVGVPARWLAGIPVLVHTKHGRNYPDNPRAVLLNRWLAFFSDSIVAVSEDAARVAVDVERIPASKVLVIHNGVELDLPLPSAAWNDWSPRAITVARLDPVKDQKTMIRAVRIIVDDCSGFQLDIVGDGPSRTELERLAAELDLSRNVRFLGYRTDVGATLRRPQVFLLSSISEGISLTLLEAMAAGLPIVATDVGGNREVVVSGTTGLLVPPGDPKAFATAVLGLVRDPARAAAMGGAGRTRAESEFDVRAAAANYHRLYTQLTNSR